MIDHDRLFKELLTTFFSEFVDLFLPDVTAYLKRDSIVLLNPELFTEVMEIVTSWMEQGIQRGLQQGRLEGRQEGELALVMRLLNRRLGAVELSLQERIQRLSLAQLEDLGEALLDFERAADLAGWLEAQTTA